VTDPYTGVTQTYTVLACWSWPSATTERWRVESNDHSRELEDEYGLLDEYRAVVASSGDCYEPMARRAWGVAGRAVSGR
jgi:hypothetical protein